jgi:hypothetical protein
MRPAFRVFWLSALKRFMRQARRTEQIMKFGLLLSNLPHVDDARAQYGSMLSLQPRESHRFATFWHRLKALVA